MVLVGQQDRRHLALEPFLAGRLAGLAGDYPVSFEQPLRPQDVPGAVVRAHHAAASARGPAIVVVPQDDWAEEAAGELAAAERVVRSAAADEEAIDELAALLEAAISPALVVGAGADDERTWEALVLLAERLDAPVWQESFGARAGFPQDHRLFAGHLPADRARLREALAYDVVLAIGAPVFRQYPYAPGPLLRDGTRAAVLTDDPGEAHRSPVEFAVIGDLPSSCESLADRVAKRIPRPREVRAALPEPDASGPLRAGHVLAALADRLPPEAVVVEETPSSRPELHARLPARRSLGFVSAAMGGLGFGLPGAAGLRMALPDRPVVAVVGDGSAMFGIQALWSAARYRAGALFIVLANDGYAVMDRLAERNGGGHGPWPAFGAIDVAAMARAQGCDARRIGNREELLAALDEVVPSLDRREKPLLLEVVVEADTTFSP